MTLYHHNGVLPGADTLEEAIAQATELLVFLEQNGGGAAHGWVDDRPNLAVWAGASAPTSGFYASVVGPQGSHTVEITLWDDLARS
jgi:hypothetical protein